MIRALNFSKFYASKKACSKINFVAERGKTSVLLGPNGAGKSTLLKALAGFHYASSGKILAQDNDGNLYDPLESSQGLKAITGFVSDVPSLYEDWTVQEFLEMAASLKLKPSADVEAAAKKAIELCNLQSVSRQKIASLSHGYKQRVNFAQALVADPQIIILDEPSSGLDPEQIRESRDLIQSLKKGRAIVFSTHIIQEAQSLADEIYIVKNGAIVQKGSVEELLKKSSKETLEDAYLFFAGAASNDLGLESDEEKADDFCGEDKGLLSKKPRASFQKLFRKEFHSFAVNPFYWILGILFSLFSAAAFFFGTRFFVQGLGSSSMSPFFLAMPYILSAFIPTFAMNAKSRAFDQSLPFSEGQKFAARLFASLLLFALYLLPTIFVPLCVCLFGSLDLGALFTGYAGLLFFAAAATSFCLFLSTFFSNRAAYFALSFLALTLVNSMHNLLTVIALPDFLSVAIRSISFAWRFDSASKGILDTRDFCAFAIWALVFLMASVFVVESRKGKKYFSKKRLLNTLTLILIALFLSLDSSRLYKRFDFSANKNYTPSARTKNLISSFDEKVRVTYYRSSELTKLYPQTRDIGDFLRSLSYSCPNLIYTELSADTPSSQKILKDLSVQPLQLQKQKNNSLEYVNAYSVVIIECMYKSLFLPAAFSTFSLEYDLNLRLDYLLEQKSRKVYLLCANGMNLQKDYKSALDWLNLEGFETIPLTANDLTLTDLDKNFPLLLIGSKNLNQEQAAALENFLQEGGSLYAMTSPYSVNVDGDWSLSKNKRDFLLPLLEKRGLAFSDSLAADLSCVRASFYSADDNSQERQNKSINYPLWLNLLPQEDCPYGAALFWASPLSIDESKARPALFSSPASWRFLPDKKNPELLFDTNPFTVPKSAIDDPLVKRGQSVLAAKSLDSKIFLLSGDLFVNDLLLSLSGGETGDFRNLNYLTVSLLRLAGEDDLAALKNKGAADYSLWKISDSIEWNSAKNISLAVNFIFVPLALCIFAFIYFSRRKSFEKKDKELLK